MTETDKTLHRFRYKIELLEDLHSGSGLGSAWVDRTIARDMQGKPMIPSSHIKGVWRDAAMRLINLGAEGFTQHEADQWFGAAPKGKADKTAPQRGRLYCPRLVPTSAGVETIVWMQTARQPGSRKPADDTLRSTEYLPAGLELVGHGFFIGSADEFKRLEQLIRRVDRYGGNRSRGDGRIRALEVKNEALPAVNLPEGKAVRYGIRLLLQAEAPVQVPRTGSPGNIIESDTRIPGRMLAGAIIDQLRDSSILPELFAQQVSIGDALPLSPDLTDVTSAQLDGLEILPAPLEYRVEKPSVEKSGSFQYLPGWVNDRAIAQPLTAWRDLLTQRHEDAQIKRLPTGTFIQRDGNNAWRAYRQPLELAMRNRRGSDVAGGAMDDELFSSEQLPARTRFVADIRAGADSSIWDAWLEAFATHFSKTPVMFIGRGGAPVRVAMVRGLSRVTEPEDAETLRVTLTSDAIIRTRWLGFHQRLTLQALCDAVGVEVPKDTTADDVSEARIDRAFNAATRLPRPSVMALRAGSTILVRGVGAATLREHIKGREAIGERQHEGLGRFLLDLDLDEGKPSSTTEIKHSAPELQTEVVARFARDQLNEHGAALKKPSQSQWGNVRAALEAIPRGNGAESIEIIRNNLSETARRTRGGEVFADIAKNNGFLHQLTRRAEAGWSMDDIRLALRLVLAQLPSQDAKTTDERVGAEMHSVAEESE